MKRSQVVVDAYLRKFVSRELASGDPLPTEMALSQEYGISRTAVREAVQVLAAKGFVQIRQGSGIIATPPTMWNVLDGDFVRMATVDGELTNHLLDARELVEVAIVRHAAMFASPDQVSELRGLVAELAEMGGVSPDLLVELELMFHKRLAEMADNPVLASLAWALGHVGLRSADGHADGNVARTVFWHAQIVDALAAHDDEGAAEIMLRHLEQVRRSDVAAAL